MPKFVVLPPNLCAEIYLPGKSVYYRDYCASHRKMKTRSLPNTYLKSTNFTSQLDSQCNTLPTGYGNEDFNNTIDSINQKMENTNINDNGNRFSTEQFIETAPDTISKIENSWVSEVDASKRNRGLIYGAAGRKIKLDQKRSKSANDKSLPGLENWLQTANEYEKEVVHKFVSNVSNSVRDQRPISKESILSGHQSQRPPTRPKSMENKRPSQPMGLKKSVRIRSAPLTPGSFKYNSSQIKVSRQHTPTTERTVVNNSPRPKASPSVNGRVSESNDIAPQVVVSQYDDVKYDGRIPSRSSTRSSHRSVDCNEVSTQLPYRYDTKPSSPLYENNKDNSDLSHSCTHCKSCRKKEVKKLLEEICKESPKQFDHIRLERSLHPRYKHTLTYPQEDYMHNGTSFQRVNKNLKKRYFVIHPDFVSENGGKLATKKKMDKKYWGESKIAAY